MNPIRPSNIYKQSLFALTVSLSLFSAAVADNSSGSTVTFASDTTVVPATYKRTETGQSRLILIGPGERLSVSPNADRQLIDSLPAQVFRVQLFTSKLYGDAARMSRIGRELCIAPVTLDYDVPYYKVRSGAFATRSEADAYVSRAKSLGFTEAWIVFASNPLRDAPPGESGTDQTANEEVTGH